MNANQIHNKENIDPATSTAPHPRRGITNLTRPTPLQNLRPSQYQDNGAVPRQPSWPNQTPRLIVARLFGFDENRGNEGNIQVWRNNQDWNWDSSSEDEVDDEEEDSDSEGSYDVQAAEEAMNIRNEELQNLLDDVDEQMNFSSESDVEEDLSDNQLENDEMDTDQENE